MSDIDELDQFLDQLPMRRVFSRAAVRAGYFSSVTIDNAVQLGLTVLSGTGPDKRWTITKGGRMWLRSRGATVGTCEKSRRSK